MGDFLSFIGYIFTKLYQVLDFKILGFPISVIHIILGTLAFAAFITFIKNISGIVTTSTGGLRDLSNINKENRIQAYRNFMMSMRRRSR